MASDSINHIPYNGTLYYHPNLLTKDQANTTCDQLLQELDWEHEKLTIMGKQISAPRLVCWYGDPRATYSYSNVKHTPLPWTPCLQGLRQTISQFTGFKFNSVLGNLYHDGQDSMGWHADNEKQLGNNPVIASLSLGAKRLFKLRHNKTKLTIDIALENGSLLLMAGSLQHHWRHCLAKTRKPVEIRINLTFRYIQTEQD